MALYEQFPLSIYNSLTRNEELFVPITPGRIGMYVCGPTVYNYVHLGNVRTFLTFDIVFRYLTFLGYKVRYVRNITDVGHLVSDADTGEDKIAKKARLDNLEPMEVVQQYTNDFHEVTRLFNFLDPSIEPTATGHIVEQIEMVKKILENGFAYEANGSVYFDVLKFQAAKDIYGDLSGRVIEELIVNTRELDGQEEKRNPLDFAIWKKADPSHLMKWPSPWGEGFPGWHLECSAMSTKYLGEQFDIHGGGMDLKFPHHECEIAQNVACHGHNTPVNYWMHSNMLTVNGQKMSKSVGNSFTPRELLTGSHPLLSKAFSAMTVRFFMLQSHYSSTLDFTNEALEAAEKGYKRLMNSLASLEKLDYQSGQADNAAEKEVLTLLDDCYRHLSADFNTARAIASLFELSSLINSWSNGQIPVGSISETAFSRIKREVPSIVCEILGLLPENAGNDELVGNLMNLFIELRQNARKNKDFATSDKIRDDLAKAGVQLKDGPGGTSFEIR